jgi:hypothetical protein
VALKEDLERLRSRAVQTAGDAHIVSRAAQLLGELVELEDRARELIESREEQPVGKLRSMPLHEAVSRIIRESGRPMHVRELGREVYRRGWRHPRPPYERPDRIEIHLASMMTNYATKFERVAPNTFALRNPSERGRQRPPRLGFVHGGGRGILASDIGDHSADPVEDERSAWRSS